MKKRSPETENRHLRRDLKKLQKAYNDLRWAGQRMSNLCFNCSQNCAFPDWLRKSMRESYREWDLIKDRP